LGNQFKTRLVPGFFIGENYQKLRQQRRDRGISGGMESEGKRLVLLDHCKAPCRFYSRQIDQHIVKSRVRFRSFQLAVYQVQLSEESNE
jgi:hypothetical protein